VPAWGSAAGGGNLDFSAPNLLFLQNETLVGNSTANIIPGDSTKTTLVGIDYYGNLVAGATSSYVSTTLVKNGTFVPFDARIGYMTYNVTFGWYMKETLSFPFKVASNQVIRFITDANVQSMTLQLRWV
jgi:hypothetical protein